MTTVIELFKKLHALQTAESSDSSKIVRENGVSQFWIKKFVKLSDGYTSLETYVYRMNDSEGLVTIYRPVLGKRMDVETLDLTEFASL